MFLIETDRIDGEKLPGTIVGGVGRFGPAGGGQEQVAGAECRIAGDESAGCAGGKAVLIVKPGEHRSGPGIVDALPDQLHEFGAEVRSPQAGAGVHVKSAHAHLVEDSDLTMKLLAVETAVPGPERGVAVEGSGVGEEPGKGDILIVRV